MVRSEAAHPTEFVWGDKPSDLRPPVEMEGEHDYLTEIHPQAEAFIRTLSDLPPSQPHAANIEDAQHDLSDLRGGPLVNAQGRLVGVNAFSSEGRITHPLSGLGFAIRMNNVKVTAARTAMAPGWPCG